MHNIDPGQIEQVREVVERHYRATAEGVELARSERNRVIRFRVGRDGPMKYLKLGTKDPHAVRREPRVIGRISRAGMNVPNVEFDGTADDGVPYFSMSARPGVRLIDACKNGEARAADACAVAGGFAARLGRLPADFIGDQRKGHDGAEIVKWLGARKENIERKGLWLPEYDEVFRQVREASATVTGLVHGDFNAGQVISEPGGAFGVMDREGGGGGGNILHDVGEFAAGMLKSGGTRAHAEAFIAGFLAQWPGNEPMKREIRAWEAYALIGAAEYHLTHVRRRAEQHLAWAREALRR